MAVSSGCYHWHQTPAALRHWLSGTVPQRRLKTTWVHQTVAPPSHCCVQDSLGTVIVQGSAEDYRIELHPNLSVQVPSPRLRLFHGHRRINARVKHAQAPVITGRRHLNTSAIHGVIFTCKHGCAPCGNSNRFSLYQCLCPWTDLGKWRIENTACQRKRRTKFLMIIQTSTADFGCSWHASVFIVALVLFKQMSCPEHGRIGLYFSISRAS